MITTEQINAIAAKIETLGVDETTISAVKNSNINLSISLTVWMMICLTIRPSLNIKTSIFI